MNPPKPISSIALVDSLHDSPSPLRWLALDRAIQSQYLSRIEGFYVTQVHSLQDGGVVIPDSCEQFLLPTIRRGMVRQERLRRLIGASGLNGNEVVFCDITGPASNRNVKVFTPIRFGTRVYHVFLRGSSKISSPADTLATINVVTGLCLFSSRTLRLITAEGVEDRFLDSRRRITSAVQEIEHNDQLSLYELECVERLSQLVTDCLSTLPEAPKKTIVLDIPRVQYYFYLIDAFAKGLITSDLMLHWFYLVDVRNQVVTHAMRAKLDGILAKHGLLGSIDICTSAGLDSLAPTILKGVKSGNILKPAKFMELLAKKDEMWELISQVNGPRNYQELVYLSYASEQLRRGINRPGSGSQIMLEIENRGEYLTHNLAKKLAAQIYMLHNDTSFSLLGLYPLERILASSNGGRPNSYSNDPGFNFIDDSGVPYTAAQVVAALYGG